MTDAGIKQATAGHGQGPRLPQDGRQSRRCLKRLASGNRRIQPHDFRRLPGVQLLVHLVEQAKHGIGFHPGLIRRHLGQHQLHLGAKHVITLGKYRRRAQAQPAQQVYSQQGQPGWPPFPAPVPGILDRQDVLPGCVAAPGATATGLMGIKCPPPSMAVSGCPALRRRLRSCDRGGQLCAS